MSPQPIVEMTYKKKKPTESERGSVRARAELSFRCFYLRSCDRISGTFRLYSHYIPDTFCAGTKTIPGKAFVHT